MGQPIVLAEPTDMLGLAIAEGIETALSAHMATGLGAWAAGSAAFLPYLADAVPGCVEAVTICADEDKNGTGQRAADELARSLADRGFEIFVEGITQDEIGTRPKRHTAR
jgi:putative DNA primase/helicase